MMTYRAWLTDAVYGNEGVYDFEGPDTLFSETPVRIVRAFMEHVDHDLFPREHVDYELNAAIKHGDHQVVTAMGSLLFDRPPAIPFTLVISRKPETS